MLRVLGGACVLSATWRGGTIRLRRYRRDDAACYYLRVCDLFAYAWGVGEVYASWKYF